MKRDSELSLKDYEIDYLIAFLVVRQCNETIPFA